MISSRAGRVTPFGTANRAALDTYLRHHFERERSAQPMTCEDLFVPYLLVT